MRTGFFVLTGYFFVTVLESFMLASHIFANKNQWMVHFFMQQSHFCKFDFFLYCVKIFESSIIFSWPIPSFSLSINVSGMTSWVSAHSSETNFYILRTILCELLWNYIYKINKICKKKKNCVLKSINKMCPFFSLMAKHVIISFLICKFTHFFLISNDKIHAFFWCIAKIKYCFNTIRKKTAFIFMADLRQILGNIKYFTTDFCRRWVF